MSGASDLVGIDARVLLPLIVFALGSLTPERAQAYLCFALMALLFLS